MKRIGFVGLGDMGMGMAKNLIKAGFQVKGFDLRADRLENFKAAHGVVAKSNSDLATNVDVIFVMVLNGDQVLSVIKEMRQSISSNTTVFITATIGPNFVKQAAAILKKKKVHVIDMPVSGGRFGADAGTLSLMVSGNKEIMTKHMDVLESIGTKIYYVGSNIGDGQIMKSCQIAYMGTSYVALFEAMVLAEKAGLDLELYAKILNESIIGSALTENTLKHIIERNFIDTGSHISTMTKDISISVEMAKQHAVPMYTTSVAREIFQAGINVMPEGDNWSIVKMLEKQAGIKRDDN